MGRRLVSFGFKLKLIFILFFSKVHTCTPAMGDSFAAGTIDGPGAFSFKQSSH